MSKIAVIYWSGTGNTEAMADLVANAAAAAGASVDKFTASEFNVSSAGDYTGFALGCPAMGAEQLEESEFEPMYQDLRGSLSGKPVGLFGSYGWGDGEWIRTWAEDAEAAGREEQEESAWDAAQGRETGEDEDDTSTGLPSEYAAWSAPQEDGQEAAEAEDADEAEEAEEEIYA